MCGRYALKTDPKVIAQDYNVAAAALADGRLATLSSNIVPVTQMTAKALTPNFNVAPTHLIPAVVRHEDEIALAAFSWGLVPSWAKDPAIGARMINARSETVEEKPSFRSAIGKRRCIVPADGWYEWEKLSATKKQPHYFSAADDSLIGFAGLYETWKQPDGSTLWSCTILTTDAWPELAYVHERMPVIMHADLRDAWLGEGPAPLAEVLDLSRTAKQIREWPVNPAVGNVRNNNETLTEPEEGSTLF